MSWITLAALFLIVWWTVLFAVLPFGVETQDDDGDVTLGTVASAPRGPHMRRAVVRTTVISVVLLGGFYGVTRGLGYGINDFLALFPSP